MIEVLIHIVCSMLLGAITAMFTRFFEYLIGNPFREEVYTKSILSFYGVWIRKNYDRVEAGIRDDSPKGHTRLNFWKAMGVCPYCLNVYVGLVVYGVAIVYTDLYWWLLFSVLAVSHYVLGWIFDKEGY